jgi:hypothetical protein
MYAFEPIAAGLLREGGYWTSIGYKVEVPKEVKVASGKQCLPRPEIEALASRARDNHLLWVALKSYLESETPPELHGKGIFMEKRL